MSAVLGVLSAPLEQCFNNRAEQEADGQVQIVETETTICLSEQQVLCERVPASRILRVLKL